ncbi:hypothetical protein KUH03_22970 [Sphingobacterium sp. E70]|nr:hypothetical protein [Sphingobacterium sp. E70]ULT22308.1 hypothetical protein KUH03_22970 [Sphingobacterium sp. E70]
MEAAYPEFSQFKELPAWGFYVRHAENIHFDRVVLRLKDKEYRPMLVFDDVNGYSLSQVKQLGAKGKKELVAVDSKKIKP